MSSSKVNPIVSVIIPAANNQNTILRAIDSIRLLKIGFEVFVIINNSNDDTAELVKNVAYQDKRVKLIFASSGRSHARNVGLKAATGKYIYFLDADDQGNITFIQKGVAILEKLKKVKAVYSDTNVIDDRINGLKLHSVNELTVDNLFIRNPFMIESVLFCRDAVSMMFDESLDYCEDWWFWVSNFTPKDFIKIDTISGTVHINGENSMSNFKKVTYFEIYMRLRIIKTFSVKSIKSFLPDLKLVVKYFQCSNIRISGLWSHMPLVAFLGLVLAKFPILSKISRKILYSSKSFNTYQ